MKTLELIQRSKIPQQLKDRLLPALAKSGKFKGQLLADAPSGNVAWQVLIGYLAPQRVKVWGMMGSSMKEYNALDEELTAARPMFKWSIALEVCEPDYRFNVATHDRAKMLNQLNEILLPATIAPERGFAHPMIAELYQLAAKLETQWHDLGEHVKVTDTTLEITLMWDKTRLKLITAKRADAVRDRADALETSYKVNKRTLLRTPSCREVQAAQRSARRAA